MRVKLPLLLVVVFMAVFVTVSSMFAAPVSEKQANDAVQGWLNLDSKPLSEIMDVNISKVDGYQNHDKDTLFYVVSLENGGYVITSADDLLEPIVAFSEEGAFDPSDNNPLWSLINGDMSGRLDFIKNVNAQNQINNLNVANTKWQQLLLASDKTEISKQGLASISDVRVAPFVQSKWSQSTVNGLATYNYYTPSNYVCGCVATAMVQLMRYHQHPISGIGILSHTISVDGTYQTAYTRGGDGNGGAYDWSSMPLVPTSSITTTQRQAIGALCYDAGVAVGMNYTSSSSGANTYAAAGTFETYLGYHNAIYAYTYSGIDIAQLNLIISSNTDSRHPVILGITGSSGGHAIVCDGYGYNSSTRYSHLNMGWSGSYNMWYALPDIETFVNFDTVYKAVYNVFPTLSGEIISGRVLDTNGNPVSGATVSADGKTDTTDANGIYGLVGISVGTHTITFSKAGCQTLTLNKTVTASVNGGTCGNVADANFTLNSQKYLSSIAISGVSSVFENNSASYTCEATYSDESTADVTSSTSWSENSSYASINDSGVLTTTDVDSSQNVTITALHTEDSITKTNTYSVMILNASTGYSGGAGTEPDPYLIANKADLLELADDTDNYDKYFKMTADIDLVGETFSDAVIAGDNSAAFTGSFDGDGHEIKNITITGTSDYVGLFGYIYYSTVTSLGVVDCDLDGADYVGGLCGKKTYGIISNCYSSGSFQGDNYVGGLCGNNYGDVTGSYSTNSVSGYDRVGGLCGSSSFGIFNNCYSAGSVSGNERIGGLCGYEDYGAISDCYSISSVEGTKFVGGLCGSKAYNTVCNCYSTGSVDGDSLVGGLCGFKYSVTFSFSFWDKETSGLSSSSGGTGKTTVEMQTESTFTDAGWNFVDTWVMNGYPQLQWQKIPSYTLTVNNGSGDGSYIDGTNVNISADAPAAGYVFDGWGAVPEIYTNNIADVSASSTIFTMPGTNVILTAVYVYNYSGGSGTEASPYLIANKADLLELGATTTDYGKHFKMTGDIDLAGNSFTNAVIAIDDSVSFTGNFDGGGHVIKNLTITGTSHYVGLFGYSYGGTINYLGVVDCDIAGLSYVGGLCGDNRGTISSCYSTGLVSGSVFVGGLCGQNSAIILSCYSTASVSGDFNVAGLCGENSGTISSCYSTGTVGGYFLLGGGLCGSNGGTILSCFWDTETSGLSTSEGGVGKTTVQMLTESTFIDAGWDFVDIWKMSGYPVLKWQGDGDEQYGLQIVNGSGSGVYLPGQEVTIESIRPDLFGFECWTVEPIEYTNNFADILSSTTTFTMPDTNVVITTALDFYSGGTGTETDPFLIANKEDLLTLGDCSQHYDKHFKMISDINLSGTNFVKAIIAPDTDSSSWDFHGTEFTGVFDGNGKKILNLSIDGNYFVGFFGYIGSGGEVRDLGIVDCNVTGTVDHVGGLCGDNRGTISSCYSTGSVSGIDKVGGLCGESRGSISSCYSTGTVLGEWSVGGICGITYSEIISSCYSAGSVSGDVYVGGISGQNLGSISLCYSTGSISGTQSTVGGICGWNRRGSISSCYSTSSVSGDVWLGGICGNNYNGTISSCYSTCSVIGTDNVGGLCAANSGSISISFWDIETSGLSTSAGGIGKTTVQMQTESTFTDAGWDFVDTWKMRGYPKFVWQQVNLDSIWISGVTSVDEGISSQYTCTILYSDGYTNDVTSSVIWSEDSPYTSINSGGCLVVGSVPSEQNITITANYSADGDETNATYSVTLLYAPYSGGSGAEADPYLIANRVNLLELSSNTADYSKCFKMIADIDLTGEIFTNAVVASDADNNTDDFQGIEFTGSFDGNDKIISNLNLTSTGKDYIGLFGNVGADGTIKNLRLDNVAVSGGNDSDYIGSLVGINYGLICRCSASGNVQGSSFVGGLIGGSHGSVSECFVAVSVDGVHHIGGLIGGNGGLVNKCYASGDVNGTGDYIGGLIGGNSSLTVSACYATGNVNGNSHVGGFIGGSLGSLEKCYSTGNVSGTSSVGGFLGTSYSCSVNFCFWDTQTAGIATSAGGTGKATALMQTESTFTDTGWDFVSTWIQNGCPELLCMLSPYEITLIDCGVPKNEQGYEDCPAGDGIQNLLKYAIGLNPMEACSAADLMEPVVDDTNGVSIVYNKAKGTEGVELFPLWSDSLIVSNWNPNGFEFSIISQTDSTETWKATHSITGKCGYIRLKAQVED